MKKSKLNRRQNKIKLEPRDLAIEILDQFLISTTAFDDRDFYEDNIIFHGAIYRKVIEKYGEASLQNLKLEKDSVLGANLASLPLLPKPDTSLNLKYFNLKLKFYPDQWFNGKILHYKIDVGVLVHRKAEAPPTK